MTKVSAPYLYRKRGVYYLQKRIPKPLIPQYGRSILQRSLRTADRAEAVRLSSQIVAALHREWQELLFALPQDGSSVYEGLITGPKQEPKLTEAMHIYLQATARRVTRSSSLRQNVAYWRLYRYQATRQYPHTTDPMRVNSVTHWYLVAHRRRL